MTPLHVTPHREDLRTRRQRPVCRRQPSPRPDHGWQAPVRRAPSGAAAPARSRPPAAARSTCRPTSAAPRRSVLTPVPPICGPLHWVRPENTASPAGGQRRTVSETRHSAGRLSHLSSSRRGAIITRVLSDNTPPPPPPPRRVTGRTNMSSDGRCCRQSQPVRQNRSGKRDCSQFPVLPCSLRQNTYSIPTSDGPVATIPTTGAHLSGTREDASV